MQHPHYTQRKINTIRRYHFFQRRNYIYIYIYMNEKPDYSFNRLTKILKISQNSENTIQAMNTFAFP